jgi:protocatechuate 3,4-dioxygenase alpha subunit
MPGITPSQTVGPYFAYGLNPLDDYDWKQTLTNNLVTEDAAGERVTIMGTVFDGDEKPINDALMEIWQADAQGRYAHPADKRRPNAKFSGFGRSGTDKDGIYTFSTIKPGAVPGPNDKMQAPHIVLCVFARGMVRQTYTRIYFPDEPANAQDPILALVPAARRDTLIAKHAIENGARVYRFDVHLQGDLETVFFDI